MRALLRFNWLLFINSNNPNGASKLIEYKVHVDLRWLQSGNKFVWKLPAHFTAAELHEISGNGCLIDDFNLFSVVKSKFYLSDPKIC